MVAVSVEVLRVAGGSVETVSPRGWFGCCIQGFAFVITGEDRAVFHNLRRGLFCTLYRHDLSPYKIVAVTNATMKIFCHSVKQIRCCGAAMRLGQGLEIEEFFFQNVGDFRPKFDGWGRLKHRDGSRERKVLKLVLDRESAADRASKGPDGKSALR